MGSVSVVLDRAARQDALFTRVVHDVGRKVLLALEAHHNVPRPLGGEEVEDGQHPLLTVALGALFRLGAVVKGLVGDFSYSNLTLPTNYC